MSRRPSTSRTDPSLAPLFEFSQVVNSSLDLTVILDTVLLTLMGKLLVTKSAVLLRTVPRRFTIAAVKGVSRSLLKHQIALPNVLRRPMRIDATFPTELREQGLTLLLPVISHDGVIGYIAVAEHPKRPVTQEQRAFAETLISVAATAIEKGFSFSEIKTVNRTLDEKVHQLKTLFELAKEFGGILDRDKLLKLFSLTLMGQVGTSRFAICMRDGASIYSKISSEYLESDKQPIFTLVTSPMLAKDIPSLKRYRHLREHVEKERIGALIPLLMQNEVRGVLCVGERLRGGVYSESDLEFIYSLANLAFVSLENSRLFSEEVEKKKLESELLIAREIQQGLLPRSLPAVNGFDVAGVNISSKQVGGDYYNVFPLEDGTVMIVIADVSGKGTPASLLMANVQATVHALAPFRLPLSEATARINDLIYRNTASDKFITFFWGILDPASRSFRYVNAGHNPPFLLRRNGTAQRLADGGLILGIMNTVIPYQEGMVTMESGDALVLYTDGVSEAMNVRGEDYTEERLETFLEGLKESDAGRIVDAVTQEIKEYSAGAPQSDDITIVVITSD